MALISRMEKAECLWEVFHSRSRKTYRVSRIKELCLGRQTVMRTQNLYPRSRPRESGWVMVAMRRCVWIRVTWYRMVHMYMHGFMYVWTFVLHEYVNGGQKLTSAVFLRVSHETWRSLAGLGC